MLPWTKRRNCCQPPGRSILYFGSGIGVVLGSCQLPKGCPLQLLTAVLCVCTSLQRLTNFTKNIWEAVSHEGAAHAVPLLSLCACTSAQLQTSGLLCDGLMNLAYVIRSAVRQDERYNLSEH